VTSLDLYALVLPGVASLNQQAKPHLAILRLRHISIPDLQVVECFRFVWIQASDEDASLPLGRHAGRMCGLLRSVGIHTFNARMFSSVATFTSWASDQFDFSEMFAQRLFTFF
jgi:hypothetical protein